MNGFADEKKMNLWKSEIRRATVFQPRPAAYEPDTSRGTVWPRGRKRDGHDTGDSHFPLPFSTGDSHSPL